MIQGITSTKTIIREESKDYFAKCFKIKFKDKYKRENETSIDQSFTPSYVRLAYDFDKKEKVLESIKLDEEYRFLPLPYIPLASEEERSCIYICGASGLGKSYLVNEICLEYRKQFPTNKIYYITKNNASHDRSLSPKEMYTFVNVNNFIKHYSVEANVNEFLLDSKKAFHNSMFIFDDVASLEKVNKDASKVMNTMIDIILENKRKSKISICVISHVSTNYKQTRLMIAEMKSYICFPSTLQCSSDRILQHYLGLSQSEIDRIVQDDSKNTTWLMIDNVRRLVLTQREIYFLKSKRILAPDDLPVKKTKAPVKKIQAPV